MFFAAAFGWKWRVGRGIDCVPMTLQTFRLLLSHLRLQAIIEGSGLNEACAILCHYAETLKFSLLVVLI